MMASAKSIEAHIEKGLMERMREDILSVLGKDLKMNPSGSAYGKRIERKDAYGNKVKGGLLHTVKLTPSSKDKPLSYEFDIITQTPAMTTPSKARAHTFIDLSDYKRKDDYVGEILEARQELLEIKDMLQTDLPSLINIQETLGKLGEYSNGDIRFRKNERYYDINFLGFAPCLQVKGFIMRNSSVHAYVDKLNEEENRKLLQTVLSAQAAKIERD